MYAVIAHGGKQYRVAPGEIVQVELVAAAAGEAVEFHDVRMVDDGSTTLLGKSLAGSKVVGTVIARDRAPKIVIFKKKRCKQYRRTSGHRQNLSTVRIERIG